MLNGCNVSNDYHLSLVQRLMEISNTNWITEQKLKLWTNGAAWNSGFQQKLVQVILRGTWMSALNFTAVNAVVNQTKWVNILMTLDKNDRERHHECRHHISNPSDICCDISVWTDWRWRSSSHAASMAKNMKLVLSHWLKSNVHTWALRLYYANTCCRLCFPTDSCTETWVKIKTLHRAAGLRS